MSTPLRQRSLDQIVTEEGHHHRVRAQLMKMMRRTTFETQRDERQEEIEVNIDVITVIILP